MKMFREHSQGQMFLLPPSLDEFVPDNHEARITNDVVDTMDLSPLLARYEGVARAFTAPEALPRAKDGYRFHVPLKHTIS
jgi:transposase